MWHRHTDLQDRVTDTEDGLVVAQGNGVREGRVGTLGLADANCDTENG